MPTRRNYLNIVQDSRVRIESNTPVNNFNAQGTTKAFVDILGLEMERVYDDLEFIYNAIDPTRATGSDLDKIGFLVGERRTSATTASDYSNTNFYFYIDPRLNWNIQALIKRNYGVEEIDVLVANGYLSLNSLNEPQSLIIPAGTRVSNRDGTIVYTTTENSNIVDQTESYVGIVATSVGPGNNVETNVIVSHSLADVPELRKISHFIKCSNRFPIQNGSYSLTDDEFRYNIATARSAIRTNELSVKRAALSIPGVRDILFEKNKFGNGTVSIIVDGISPLISDGLIEAVRQKIQQELSYGDVVFVDKPKYLGVEIQFDIIVEPGIANSDVIRSIARDRVIQYINDLPIGGQIVWNQIVSQVINIQGVTDFIPRIFKYGEYDSFNKLNKKQIILRFVNQQAKFDEKWYTDSGLVQCCTV
jgi:uncharacterized phage protein gp47/JayE